MPERARRRSVQQLWMLPVFALVSPPVVFVLALLVGGLYGLRLLEAYWLLALLSPVLGLVTLIILLVQISLVRGELEPLRISRRRTAWLAGLAIIAPVWLAVMYFAVAVFNR
jgi:hypothetical protein